ncbi:hypothetical protein [Sphingomonas xanthus]|uniref:C-type lysozyme inhibitor domain-containing protein n=1 Tax=Sphingomonas xanthus TaxID=2594473 RepID=A0A516IPW0_9SPHN|nr:hypothetical protein [Sphingomonas xanthus]QDP18906.1 hypothetical protein FMM02_02365 [Sphingomonas xanthus]
MIRLFIASLALAAVPASAQQPALTFETGKALPISPGAWSYSATPAGSEARYGNLLSIRCDRTSRTVIISRPGTPPAVLSIATSALTRAIPSTGRVAATDPLLDAIAFSRGRFLVWGGAGATLAIPSWPEAARSIEDCRI